MKTFKISVLKTYTMDYLVQAKNHIEALESLYDDKLAKPDLDSLTFIEDSDSCGMSKESFLEAFPDTDTENPLPFEDTQGNYLETINNIEEVK